MLKFYACTLLSLLLVLTFITHPMDEQETPLQASILRGTIMDFRALLSRETANEQTSEGDTALHLAIRYGREEMLKELLALGVNLEEKNNAGQTPLDIANEEIERTQHSPDEAYHARLRCRDLLQERINGNSTNTNNNALVNAPLNHVTNESRVAAQRDICPRNTAIVITGLLIAAFATYYSSV